MSPNIQITTDKTITPTVKMDVSSNIYKITVAAKIIIAPITQIIVEYLKIYI